MNNRDYDSADSLDSALRRGDLTRMAHQQLDDIMRQEVDESMLKRIERKEEEAKLASMSVKERIDYLVNKKM